MKTYWSKLVRAYYPDEAFNVERYMLPPLSLSVEEAQRLVREAREEKVFINQRYQVAVREIENGITHLSVKRRDRMPIHDWRDLQRIKNELCGGDREAVEIYPAEDRKVDAANQFHLWVLPKGERVPFGFKVRAVWNGSFNGSEQRPYDDEDPGATESEKKGEMKR